MNTELNRTLFILQGLANKAILLNTGEHNSDLQKAIVGIIRGSEFAFKELTGVEYHPVPEETKETSEITSPN